MHTFHLTRVSANAKTGPIPVTTSSKSTCPTSCPLKGNGCYAEYGPLGMHWNQLSIGNRGVTLDELCTSLSKLPKHQLWRWAQAGDLPGDGQAIDEAALNKITRANKGRRGFGFTHYDPNVADNGAAILAANLNGFTVNLSADNLQDADYLADADVGPVVCVLPAGTTKPLCTPAGRFVAICPATVRDDVQCANCGICAHATRKAIVGFPAHGSGVKKAEKVFFMRQTMPENYANLTRSNGF